MVVSGCPTETGNLSRSLCCSGLGEERVVPHSVVCPLRFLVYLFVRVRARPRYRAAYWRAVLATASRCVEGSRTPDPNWKPSPNRISTLFSKITFPITILPKDDHTDIAQEERLDFPHWTMILAICVVVDESKCLDVPIWEFSIICEHLPFSLGCKPILRLLLVLHNLAIWR